jgi:hypothetical protein
MKTKTDTVQTNSQAGMLIEVYERKQAITKTTFLDTLS